MNNALIAAAVAAVPALYLMWRIYAIGYQDGWLRSLRAGVAILVGGVVWTALFFVVGFVLEAVGVR